MKWLFVILAFSSPLALCVGQEALKSMPAYQRYERMTQERTNAFKTGAVSVRWVENGKALEYTYRGKRYHYEISRGYPAEIVPRPKTIQPPQSEPRRPTRKFDPPVRPARGRQYASAVSPDEKFTAFYRDRNLWLRENELVGDQDSAVRREPTPERALTTEGNDRNRKKFGTATWTYGEELDQNSAIWWSPDSSKVAYYGVDESQVRDYYLTLDHTRTQTRLDVEPYPKAGTTNPVVDLFIHDLASGTTVQLDVRDGQPFTDGVVGHYVYGIEWLAHGEELLFHRTNRRQNIMELCAANPVSGQCRVIIREEWLPSWTENNPTMRWLKDGRRFIWSSERTGWRNYYLYDTRGTLLASLTGHDFDVLELLEVDEERGEFYYFAASGDNPLKPQLHRARLDGTANRRLTNPAFHHQVKLAPDFNHFTDIAQTHCQPPVTRLVDREGRVIDTLATSDLSKFEALKMRRVELLEFQAADGVTRLYGNLHYPSNFKPRKRYPVLVDVYAGPGTVGATEQFSLPNILTEFGFLFARFDSRSASGRGKRALDAIYVRLGQVEIDDQAAGVKSLWPRRYVDRRRVGIFGTSYGGTASALCLLRYPEVFHAACASSAVTDFRNYDTIYTERYLWLPQADSAVYDGVKVMSYVKNLQGHLMLFYGTADDNVHPSNTLQLIQALQDAGKSFEVQVGPDDGHASLNRDRMMEFFLEHLGEPRD